MSDDSAGPLEPMRRRADGATIASDQHVSGRPTPLCRNSSDGPLRILMAVAAVFTVGGAMLAGMLLDSTVHLSHHISFAQRAVWATLLMGTFSGLLAGAWMYSRRLATGIDLSADGRQLRVSSPTLMGASVREISVDQLSQSSYYEGDARGHEASSPPYVWVKVNNERSFVVPLSGEIPSRKKLLQALQVDRRDLN